MLTVKISHTENTRVEQAERIKTKKIDVDDSMYTKHRKIKRADLFALIATVSGNKS
jgi:hypothetical protein